MDVRQLIRSGITASAIAHLLVLALVLLFSEVHPFGAVTAEPITVDLVTPEEVAKKPEPEEKPQLPQPDLAALAQPPSPPPAAPATREESRARAEPQEAAAQPQSSPQPTHGPPEPDLTVKYHVVLGLPDAPPPASSSDARPGDGVDATASNTANISSSVVAAFRKHLKTCSRLPASISPSDNVMVKLRVLMTPGARLAGEPILIEGTASMKGVELKQSAVQALAACQPYDMLPADRYGEWKVLDLSFTPQDFV
jgi:type IV secretory pathway VirB10-like protein